MIGSKYVYSAGFNIFSFQNAGFWPLPGKMTSWCSFRCPCLDELGSKSDLKILYFFFVAKCVHSMFFGEAHGRLEVPLVL